METLSDLLTKATEAVPARGDSDEQEAHLDLVRRLLEDVRSHVDAAATIAAAEPA